LSDNSDPLLEIINFECGDFHPEDTETEVIVNRKNADGEINNYISSNGVKMNNSRQPCLENKDPDDSLVGDNKRMKNKCSEK